MEDAERLLLEIEERIGVEAAAILNPDGNVFVSHIPEEEQDVIQSLLFSLGGVAVSSFVAELGSKVIGLKKTDKFILAVVCGGEAERVHSKLNMGVAMFREAFEEEGIREGVSGVSKPALMPRLTPAIRRFAMEMRVPAEFIAFSVPTKKIFTLEFMNSSVSKELSERFGGWVVEFFTMIDGEKNIKTLADMLGRDVNEVIMVVAELVKSKAVTVKRIDISSMSGEILEKLRSMEE